MMPINTKDYFLKKKAKCCTYVVPSHKKSRDFHLSFFSTEGGNRTRKPCEQWILNPSCLPIPPLRHTFLPFSNLDFESSASTSSATRASGGQN